MANWTCPYCNHAQAQTTEQSYGEVRYLELNKHKHSPLGFQFRAHACSNDNCGEVSLIAALFEGGSRINDYPNSYFLRDAKRIEHWDLRPSSTAKHLPNYIPEAIRADYYECCKIRDLSPKASATLARRCLQGMIRDFCKISKGRLIDEIEMLRKVEAEGKAPSGVTAESIEAIDAVRKIGNIGAHMEKDIGIIVDVDPGEAQVLIELVEMLLDDWYVSRHKRQERLAAVKTIAADKISQAAKGKAASSPAAQGTSDGGGS